jgi:L-ascorbate metabolism protein UlaG (beta-lactamase superfamily)
MRLGNIELRWLGHSGFLIENQKIIYIDPYKLEGEMPEAEIILITHSHYDHCSIQDLEKIVREKTVIICPANVQSKVTRLKKEIEIVVVEPGQEVEVRGIRVKAVPAYNTDKNFHPKDEGWVGYIVEIGNTVIYHGGDTDFIPEMEKLTGYSKKGNEFVALLPVGGTYTMNSEEAARAASLIKATLTIPMHFGSTVGTSDDARKFCEISEEKGIKCSILKKT